MRIIDLHRAPLTRLADPVGIEDVVVDFVRRERGGAVWLVGVGDGLARGDVRVGPPDCARGRVGLLARDSPLMVMSAAFSRDYAIEFSIIS